MLKRNCRNIFIAVAVLSSPAAFATDWTGGFIGLSAESNKMDTRLDESTTYIYGGPSYVLNYMGDRVPLTGPANSYARDNFSDRASDGGFIAGYDWQMNNWVMGVELDISSSKNEQTQYDSFTITTTPSYEYTEGEGYDYGEGGYLVEGYALDLDIPYEGGLDVPLDFETAPTHPETATTKTTTIVTSKRVETKNNYSLRFRTGYLVAPNVLIYGVAGLATQDTKVKSQCFSSAATCYSNVGYQHQSKSKSMEGLLLGVGTEVMFNDHWSIRLEYNQVDYGNFSNRSDSYQIQTMAASSPADVDVTFYNIQTNHTQLDVKSSNTEFTVVYKF